MGNGLLSIVNFKDFFILNFSDLTAVNAVKIRNLNVSLCCSGNPLYPIQNQRLIQDVCEFRHVKIEW